MGVGSVAILEEGLRNGGVDAGFGFRDAVGWGAFMCGICGGRADGLDVLLDTWCLLGGLLCSIIL